MTHGHSFRAGDPVYMWILAGGRCQYEEAFSKTLCLEELIKLEFSLAEKAPSRH